VNYQNYLASVRERLTGLGFAEVAAPDGLGLVLERQESWGRLAVGLPPALAPAADGAAWGALAGSSAAWVQTSLRQGEPRRYLILVYPFEKKVSEETAERIKALRQEDPRQRWGLVAWPADLEVELIDRPAGFPKVDDKVARALTEVPRGAVEGLLLQATGPKIGRRTFGMNMGYVPATRVIMAATIAYYLWVLLISGSTMNVIGGAVARDLTTWGANDSRLVLEQGQHWRLLTYVLLHGGLMHLVLNMWALWSLGRHVELIYGSRRMVYIYIFAGIAGGIASAAFRAYPVISVGASGAVLGMMGALVYFAVGMRGAVDWRAFMGPVVINLFYGFFIRGIDNHAHIGGFIGGVIAAFLVGIPGQRKPWRVAAMVAGGVVMGLVLSGLVPLPRL
jgi:membrane associated rhomboid family serine protease